MRGLIAENDGPFKDALDRYKYPGRYEGVTVDAQRKQGSQFINKLEQLLAGKKFLFGNRISVADIAILPFIRQFAHVDRDWFWQQDWQNVIRWLEDFLESDRFSLIMEKYPQWKIGDEPLLFQVLGVDRVRRIPKITACGFHHQPCQKERIASRFRSCAENSGKAPCGALFSSRR